MRMPHRYLPLAYTLVCCASCGGGVVGLLFGDTGAIESGTNDGGFTGFLGLRLSSQLGYLFGNPIGPPVTGDSVQVCYTTGACALAGTDSVFGMVGGVGPFTFVSTADFFNGDSTVVVVKSGVTTQATILPSLTSYKALRLRFHWAYLTSRLDPATHDDSAVVRIVAGADSAQALLVTAADLASGRMAQVSGGCGAQAIGGNSATYATCTAWATATLDVTRFAGQSVEIHFIVSRANQPLTDTVDAPSALLFQLVTIEGGR